MHEIQLYKITADNRQEQRYVIQHYCRQEKIAYEVFEILKTTYGGATLSQAMVYQWYTAFRSGRESDKLKGGPCVLRTKLIDRTVNTAAAIKQDNAQIVVLIYQYHITIIDIRWHIEILIWILDIAIFSIFSDNCDNCIKSEKKCLISNKLNSNERKKRKCEEILGIFLTQQNSWHF